MAFRNASINPVLRFIYLLLRVISWLGIVVFYRRRLLLGRENLRFDGPAIVVVNHPNTLLDVLVPGVHIHQEMFFLANYGLFKNPVAGWLLRRLFCIPVKRREDVAEGEARNNDAAFEQSYRHLEKNGVLFVAPEGTSFIHRFVREFKTGTARIAFGAEARNAWKLDLKIIPIGLSYTAPHRFRSESVVNVGTPVYPRDWAPTWQEDPEAAVDQLTAVLENQVKALTIHARDEAGERFLQRLETMLQTEQPLSQQAAFFRSQQLTNEWLDDADLREKTETYSDLLAQNGLTDAGLAATTDPDNGAKNFRQGLFLLLGLPVFLLGYAFWWLPCWLPAGVNRRLNLYVGYGATVKVLVGLFTFPLALWGAVRLVRLYADNVWLGWAVIPALFLAGLFAERWREMALGFRARQKASAFARQNPAGWSNLLNLRRTILQTLSAASPQPATL